MLREAIEVAARAGVYNTVQWATADLGLALLAVGRVEEASQCFSRAGSVPDQVGDDAGKILAIYGNALVAQRGGQRVAARALFERAYTGLERLGVRLATGLALAGIAGRDEQAGDLAAARNAYEKLLTLGQSWAEAGLIVGGLEGLARSDLAHADPVGAAELLARAAWLRDAYDRPATAPERAAADRVAAQARTALGAQRYAEAANRGAAAAAGAAV